MSAASSRGCSAINGGARRRTQTRRRPAPSGGYVVDLDAELHDIRGKRDTQASVYHTTNYAAGQVLAYHLREAGSYGIAYNSVRHAGGECVAVFRPKALSNCRQERHLCYVWDGEAISTVYEKSELKL
ncbi:RES family NAD+ phosphorylase [Acidocella sp. KAb 2-4]|uniref:RES family NAD+ phosphorylase n=1 Tax=Acidocella sp. KAb 2-4 TaxID=2885158 RepID=UPI001D075F9B|nr:RES family NAD+ phosphorylase [Acidocella sp. KAb 2-4]